MAEHMMMEKITWRDGVATIYHIIRYNLTIRSFTYIIGIVALGVLFYLKVL